MNPITFFVEGKPLPQPRVRPRLAKGRRFLGMWMPDDAKDWRERVSLFSNKARPATPIETPVFVELVCLMPRPKSHFRTGKFSSVLRDDAPDWPGGDGDNDNLEKSTWDALTKAGFWRNDALVVGNLTLCTFVNAHRGEKVGAWITIRDPFRPFSFATRPNLSMEDLR